MLVVAALGGNALQRRGESPDPENQRRNIATAAQAVAALAEEHDVVVTHGNGPQIGQLALQSEALGGTPRTPLDQLGAESEGLIGYQIERALAESLPDQALATLLTMVEVDPADPAFARPTKPIGPFYDEAAAAGLETTRGWQMAREGAGFRRVVPSPVPRRILELRTIGLLVEHGVLVICAGGGGIPVAMTEDGSIRGVEAVIDKDRAAALLAEALNADALLLLTDVDAVERNWGTGDAEPIAVLHGDEAMALRLDPGSMGPKVEAACEFATRTGGLAGIGALKDAPRILSGQAGTIVRSR